MQQQADYWFWQLLAILVIKYPIRILVDTDKFIHR